jgi:hypothetical protein
MNKIPCPTEAQEGAALAQWLDMRGILYCHVPNGGNRSAVTGASLKRQGAKKGVPDYLIFTQPPRQPCRHAIAIELKRRSGGTVGSDQRMWLEALEAHGWATRVCKGAQEAINWLTELGY